MSPSRHVSDEVHGIFLDQVRASRDVWIGDVCHIRHLPIIARERGSRRRCVSP